MQVNRKGDGDGKSRGKAMVSQEERRWQVKRKGDGKSTGKAMAMASQEERRW